MFNFSKLFMFLDRVIEVFFTVKVFLERPAIELLLHLLKLAVLVLLPPLKLVSVLVEHLDLCVEEPLPEACRLPDACDGLGDELLQILVDSARIALHNQTLQTVEVRIQENVDVCWCQGFV